MTTDTVVYAPLTSDTLPSGSFEAISTGHARTCCLFSSPHGQQLYCAVLPIWWTGLCCRTKVYVCVCRGRKDVTIQSESQSIIAIDIDNIRVHSSS